MDIVMKMISRYCLYLFAFAFMILGSGCHSFESNPAYIKRITGIALPTGTETIEEVDNGEFVLVCKYLINRDSCDAFIARYKLKPSNDLDFFSEGYLKESNRPDYSEKQALSLLTDCRRGNNWAVLLNQLTGELWIQVDYPDMAGDEPPCEK